MPREEVDEYAVEGKSIQDIHELTENDDWARPQSFEQLADNAMKEVLDDIIDKMKKDGRIADTESDPAKEDMFVDPENNEDLSIHSENMTVFWRIVMPNRRLIEVVNVEPSVRKLAINGQNNSAGCWIAFTSKRIAKRIADQLTAKGFVVDCHMCDKNGVKQNGTSLPKTVIVEEDVKWRPWQQIGEKTDEPYKVDEFYYCISVDPGLIKVYFVPKTYWDEYHKIFAGEINIEHLVKDFLTKRDHYCYTSTQSELQVQINLDRKGFRENLLFNAYINEERL